MHASVRPIAVTSIPPLKRDGTPESNDIRLARIRRAIRSFEANGFAVTSVNPSSEIAELAELYSTVSFEGPEARDGVFTGRYGPTFAALFETCRKGCPSTIINADVYLIGSDIVDHLIRNPETFFVARRADIGSDDHAYMGTYGRGVDALFFDPDRYRPLIDDEVIGRLQLGAPFWDIIVPVVASFHGIVEFIRPPFILHTVHEAKWSDADYAVLRAFASNAVLRHARLHAASNVVARRFVGMAERLVGTREVLETRDDTKAIAQLIDAWLKRIEQAQAARIAIDPTDPVLRAAVGSAELDLDRLAELESDWGARKPPPPGIFGTIRMALRRRRLARHTARWNRVFDRLEREFPPTGRGNASG